MRRVPAVLLLASAARAADRIEFNLSGAKWQMEGMLPGRGLQEGFDWFPAGHVGSTFLWTDAKIPGDVYTDSWRSGRLEDPYFGRNLEKAKWVMEREWWYTEQRLWPGENKLRQNVKLPNARLWWPWDQGKQDRYAVDVKVTMADQTVDAVSTAFGVRTVRLAMNPGFTKDEVEYPWTVMVNGRRHYLRSAAWGGPPSILYGRTGREHYKHLISEA